MYYIIAEIPSIVNIDSVISGYGTLLGGYGFQIVGLMAAFMVVDTAISYITTGGMSGSDREAVNVLVNEDGYSEDDAKDEIKFYRNLGVAGSREHVVDDPFNGSTDYVDLRDFEIREDIQDIYDREEIQV